MRLGAKIFVRAWLLFFTLVIGVVFNLIPVKERKSPNDEVVIVDPVTFPFSDYTLSKHTFWYFVIEHANLIIIAACFFIPDNTPKWLFILFFGICILDLIHFRLFYRSDGSGYNILKALLFAIPMIWTQVKFLRR